VPSILINNQVEDVPPEVLLPPPENPTFAGEVTENTGNNSSKKKRVKTLNDSYLLTMIPTT
jgi:hypothetical protein